MEILNVCKDGWPLQPQCSNILGLGLYSIMSLATIICFAIPNRRGYRIMDGTLPLSFYVASLSLLLLIAIDVSYVFFIFYLHHYTHLLLILSVVKGIFWLCCFSSLVRSRDEHVLPYSLAISICLVSFLYIIPVFAWSTYFDAKSYNNGELAFYLTESLLILVTLLATTVFKTRRSPSSSAWSGFSRKISLILPFIWPRKSFELQIRVALCLFLLVFGRLINVALPLYSKWIVDGLSDPLHFSYSLIFISTFLKFLQGNGAMGGFLNTMRSYLWIPIQQYTTRELEVELFDHLHALSLRWHLSRNTGLVLRIMDRGTSSVNSILNYLLFNIVPTLTDIAIAVVFFLTTFNIYFGIMVFITMILYLSLTITLTEWRTKFIREMNEKDNKYSAIGTDSLLNYETVKYYGNEDFEVCRFRAAIESYQLSEWTSSASLALLNFSQNSIIGLGMMAGSLLVSYIIITEKTLTVGDYVLFTTYILQLYAPLNFFGTVYRTIQKSFVDMENMFDLMNQVPEVQDSCAAVDYEVKRGQISVRNLSFAYTPDRPVLHDISFEVGGGQTVALVGPSGSGKSTIIRLLFRLFEANDESISFDDQDIKSITMKSLRKQIGIVPQDTVLFNDTIRYNIRFGNLNASDQDVEEAAKAAMIHDKIISLPAGYETMVGERGLKLSGGEKQRVAIARTILKKPQYIFLDEATSALDSHTERKIQDCLEKLCASRTGVVVAHRLSTIVNVDCILVLDKGYIVERGSHSELIEKQGIYYSMWQTQNESREDSEKDSTE